MPNPAWMGPVWADLELHAVLVFGWHARDGTPDPTDLAAGHRLSRSTVVLDSASLVFREGWRQSSCWRR